MNEIARVVMAIAALVGLYFKVSYAGWLIVVVFLM